MRNRSMQVASIIGSLVLIFCVWWYLIYVPLRNQRDGMQLAKTAQAPLSEELLDSISTTSLISCLLRDAQSNGIVINECFSGENDTQNIVILDMHCRTLAVLLHFFESIAITVPQAECLELVVQRADAAHSAFDVPALACVIKFGMSTRACNFTVLEQFLKTDPFCISPACTLLAQGSCTDLGIEFKVKKQGDKIIIERQKKALQLKKAEGLGGEQY